MIISKKLLIALLLLSLYPTSSSSNELVIFNDQALKTCHNLLIVLENRLEYCASDSTFIENYNALIEQRNQLVHHMASLYNNQLLVDKTAASAHEQLEIINNDILTYKQLIPPKSNKNIALSDLVPEHLKNYSLTTLTAIDVHTPSNFFHRKWKKAALYGAAAITGLVGLYYYRNALASGAQKIKSIFKTNVVQPVQEFVDLYKTSAPVMPPVPDIFPSPEPLEETRVNYYILHKKICEQDYLSNPKNPLVYEYDPRSDCYAPPIGSTIPALQQNEINKTSWQCAQNATFGETISRLWVQAKGYQLLTSGNSTSDLGKLWLLQQFLITGQYAYDGMRAGDYHQKAIAATMKFMKVAALFSMIPATNTLYNSYKLLTSKKNTLPQLAKTAFHHIESLLIKNLNQDQSLSFLDQGLIIHWSFSIEDVATKLVSKNNQRNFIEDLNSLRNPEYTALQRKAILDSMYRIYDFMK